MVRGARPTDLAHACGACVRASAMRVTMHTLEIDERLGVVLLDGARVHEVRFRSRVWQLLVALVGAGEEGLGGEHLYSRNSSGWREGRAERCRARRHSSPQAPSRSMRCSGRHHPARGNRPVATARRGHHCCAGLAWSSRKRRPRSTTKDHGPPRGATEKTTIQCATRVVARATRDSQANSTAC